MIKRKKSSAMHYSEDRLWQFKDKSNIINSNLRKSRKYICIGYYGKIIYYNMSRQGFRDIVSYALSRASIFNFWGK